MKQTNGSNETHNYLSKSSMPGSKHNKKHNGDNVMRSKIEFLCAYCGIFIKKNRANLDRHEKLNVRFKTVEPLFKTKQIMPDTG